MFAKKEHIPTYLLLPRKINIVFLFQCFYIPLEYNLLPFYWFSPLFNKTTKIIFAAAIPLTVHFNLIVDKCEYTKGYSWPLVSRVSSVFLHVIEIPHSLGQELERWVMLKWLLKQLKIKQVGFKIPKYYNYFKISFIFFY